MNLDDAVSTLITWEGECAWMYLDTRGYVTTGIGHLVRDADAACALPWQTLDPVRVPARPMDVRQAFAEVQGARPGMPADTYAHLTSVRLSEEDIRALAKERLRLEFLPTLRSLFAGFDGYPDTAQRALVDIAWNVGGRGISLFQRLRGACERGDWSAAAAASHVVTSREDRNHWRAEMLRAAGRSEAVG